MNVVLVKSVFINGYFMGQRGFENMETGLGRSQ